MFMDKKISELPTLTSSQMREVDRAMVEDYKILLIQMMENAGRNLAKLARKVFLGSDPRGKNVTIMAGSGGNGGGALVSARHLHNMGANVVVLLSKNINQLSEVTKHQSEILVAMGVQIHNQLHYHEVTPTDLFIDGILGYGLRGAPYGQARELIRFANDHPAPILALDTPSGFSTSSGFAHNPTIKASATMTLALPKIGFKSKDFLHFGGELHLADISVPPALYSQPPLNLMVGNIFAESEIFRLVFPDM